MCFSAHSRYFGILKNKFNGSLLKDYIFTRSRSGITSTRNVQWIDLGSDLGRRHFASTSSTNGHTTRTSPTYGRKMGIYLKYVEFYCFLNVGFFSRFFFIGFVRFLFQENSETREIGIEHEEIKI